METTFVGRQNELKLIDRLWNSPKAEFLVVYGRRRVGKTRLLTHWLRQAEGRALYWMAESTSAYDQLRSFSQALYSFVYPNAPMPPSFSYDTWEQALYQAGEVARDQRFALFIDEVTYIIDVNPDFVGMLQKVWDHWLKNSNLLLALCGSQMGLMQRHLLDYKAPLHGRYSATIKLEPLPFGVTKQFFTGLSPLERLKLYAIWGGVPAYWERLDPSLSIMGNLRAQLQPSTNWMIDEPRFLLQDFVNDPHNYIGIMRAIAEGNQSMSKISDRIGLTSGSTSKYLGVLRDTGFVVRRVPLTRRGTSSRQGRYFITDPYLRFYYRFLTTFQNRIVLGQIDSLLDSIQERLPEFITANTWKQMCHQWVLLASGEGILPMLDEVGSEWKRSYTLDVVGLNRETKTIVIGACVWDRGEGAVDQLSTLIKHTPAVIPDEVGGWQVHYVMFSVLGWHTDDHHACESLLVETRERRHWEPIDVHLLDLAEVDRNMTQWLGIPVGQMQLDLSVR